MKFSVALRFSTLFAALSMAASAEVQTGQLAPAAQAMLIRVEAQDAEAETLRLLTGIGEIRADLKLGLLLQGEGGAEAGGASIAHAQETVLPGLAEGLAAAGAPDLAPLLKALAEAKGGAVKDAYHDAEAALMKARSALNPPSAVVLKSVVAMAQSAADRIEASGTTPVGDYQMAWELLMVARGELDLLAHDPDPTVVKLAAEKAMAFDDVILFLPDPAQTAPVPVDRGLILELISELDTLAKDA